MELAGGRQRVMTLSEQLAVPDSTYLRDVKDHNSRRRRGRGEALTLATALVAEERAATAAATSASGGRTLLDILGDEEDGRDDGAASTASSARLGPVSAETPRPEAGTRTLEAPSSEWTASFARLGTVSAETPRPERGTSTLEAVLSEDRAALGDGGGSAEAAAAEPPARLSLMALIEQTEWNGRGGGGDSAVGEEGEEAHVCRCCVCMVKHKGAAFIPCGHTFCRLCSRELRLRRGSCPLCNAAILDILDIY